MLKVAILAAALAAASTAQAVQPAPAPGAAPVEAGALDPMAPVAEPDVLATPPAPAVDWTPLHPAPHAGLAFKDAAAEPAPAMAAMPDAGRRRGLIPALFALGALVVLLRQRPL